MHHAALGLERAQPNHQKACYLSKDMAENNKVVGGGV